MTTPSILYSPTARRAFTLVELSIVLVILGLLVGGVLAGQSLIHSAELRSIGEQQTEYKTAINAFREKYFGYPGDITNATAFWGKNNAACPGDSGSAATDGTCNGDGDGFIEGPAAGNGTGEAFQAWKQLSLAGMVEGNYTGLSGPSCCSYGLGDYDYGVNSPKSKFSGVGWAIAYLDNSDAVTTDWVSARDHRHNLTIGGDDGIGADDNFLTEEDAWNIDSKYDDGKPARGFVETDHYYCTTNTTVTDFDADFALSTTGKNCALLFKY